MIIKTLNDLKKVPVQDFLQGYEIDRKKTCKQYPAFENKATGERIVTHQNKNGDYVLWSSFGYKGTIIDYLQNHENMSIKDIADKYLDKTISTPTPVQNKGYNSNPNIDSSADNQICIDKFKKYWRGKYSEKVSSIGISKDNFNALANKGYIKESSFSLVFPFYKFSKDTDTLKVCGIYHHKTDGKKVFEKNSQRVLGILTENENNPYAIVCEQPVDALCHRELMKLKGKDVSKVTYLHSGGTVGTSFLNELSKFLEKKQIKHLYTGFDNDKQGREFTQLVKDVCKEKNVSCSAQVPTNNDWQDDLTNKMILEEINDKQIPINEYISSKDNNKDRNKLKFLLECSPNPNVRLQVALKLDNPNILEKAGKKENDVLIATLLLIKAEQIENNRPIIDYNYNRILANNKVSELKSTALYSNDVIEQLVAIYKLKEDSPKHLEDLLNNKDFNIPKNVKEELQKELNEFKQLNTKSEKVEDYEYGR